jgi:hypothetical protein
LFLKTGFHVYKVPGAKITEMGKVVVVRAGGSRDGELVFDGYQVSVGEDEELWRPMVVMAA